MGAAVKYRTRVILHWVFGINACLIIVTGLYQNTGWIYALGCLLLALELAVPPKP